MISNNDNLAILDKVTHNTDIDFIKLYFNWEAIIL